MLERTICPQQRGPQRSAIGGMANLTLLRPSQRQTRCVSGGFPVQVTKVHFCHPLRRFPDHNERLPHLVPTRCDEPHTIHYSEQPWLKLSGTNESCNVTRPWEGTAVTDTRDSNEAHNRRSFVPAFSGSLECFSRFQEESGPPHRRPASSPLPRPSLTAGRHQETQKDAKTPEGTPGEGHRSPLPPPKAREQLRRSDDDGDPFCRLPASASRNGAFLLPVKELRPSDVPLRRRVEGSRVAPAQISP